MTTTTKREPCSYAPHCKRPKDHDGLCRGDDAPDALWRQEAVEEALAGAPALATLNLTSERTGETFAFEVTKVVPAPKKTPKPTTAQPADALARPWRWEREDMRIVDDEGGIVLELRTLPHPRVLVRLLAIPELVSLLEGMQAYTAEGDDDDETGMHALVDREDRILAAIAEIDADNATGGPDA